MVDTGKLFMFVGESKSTASVSKWFDNPKTIFLIHLLVSHFISYCFGQDRIAKLAQSFHVGLAMNGFANSIQEAILP